MCTYSMISYSDSVNSSSVPFLAERESKSTIFTVCCTVPYSCRTAVQLQGSSVQYGTAVYSTAELCYTYGTLLAGVILTPSVWSRATVMFRRVRACHSCRGSPGWAREEWNGNYYTCYVMYSCSTSRQSDSLQSRRFKPTPVRRSGDEHTRPRFCELLYLQAPR